MQSIISEDLPLIKVVLVGESGTGKTSLINKYCNSVFTDETKTTIGSSYQSKVITLSNQKEIKLEIWDTAGQEKYRSLNKLFYQDAKILIFIYDITNIKTYEEIKSYWIHEVKKHMKNDAVFAIAGNKNDLFVDEKISEVEVEEYAKKNEMLFKLVSAKTNEGIDKLFMEIAERYCKEIQERNVNSSISLSDNESKITRESMKDRKKWCC